jgi:hypothetical protein
MKVSRRSIVAFAFVLVALLALRSMFSLGGALASDVSLGVARTHAPTAAPAKWYPTQGTLDNVTQCTSRVLQQYQLRDAPLQPPEDGEYYGCFGGFEPTESGPKGATKCRNKYNGNVAPPQKFKHTGGKWYGCSFNVAGNLWDCPKCEV